MIGRNFYFQIIFRIILIVLFSLIAGFLLASGQSDNLDFFVHCSGHNCDFQPGHLSEFDKSKNKLFPGIGSK